MAGINKIPVMLSLALVVVKDEISVLGPGLKGAVLAKD